MELVFPVCAPKSRKRPVNYVVVIRGRIAFEHETMSAAFAWRDGFGSGQVFERVTVQKAVIPHA